MGLDGLYACFPAFPKEEIEKIFNEVKNKPEDGGEENVISVNFLVITKSGELLEYPQKS